MSNGRGTWRGERLTVARYRELVLSGEIVPGTAKAYREAAARGEEVRADKLTTFSGAPAWDDPRRCQSRKNHRLWALRGSKYCYRCQPYKGQERVPLRDLPVFYSRVLRETLADAVEAQLGLHPDEQCNLYEELALTRVMAGDALSLWDAARSLPEANPKRIDLLSQAESVVRGALAEVRTMCEAANRVRAGATGRVSVHNLQHVVAQLVRISYEVFGKDGEDDVAARRFEALVREQLRLVDEERPGTTIVPGGDVEVLAMDATVPAVKTNGRSH